MSEGVLLALLSRFSRRQVSQWRQSTSCLWNQRPSQCFSSIAGSTCGEGHSDGHFGVGNLHSTNATRNVLRENNGAFSPLPKRLIHTTNVCHASRRNFYDVLGVSPNADARELKAAYYRLAKKLHPDNSKDPEALEKFQELQKAYSTLKDTDKRRQYDQMGHDNYERMDSSGGGGPEGSPFEDFGSVHDIFSAFMGGRRGGGFHSADDFFSGSGFGSGFVAQVQQNVQISFMEAVQGCSREVHLGSGRQKVKVEFEAGVNSGDMLSVRPNPNVEVILNVSIKPHKIFRREGLNIIRLVDVDVTDALLGTTVSVDTVHGKTIHVAVPECSQNGDRLVVHGEGVRSRKKHGSNHPLSRSSWSFTRFPQDSRRSEGCLRRKVTGNGVCTAYLLGIVDGSFRFAFRKGVAAPSDRFSKIFEHGNGLIAKSGPGSRVPRPCQHLARHVQAYLRVLDRIESEGALPSASFDVEQILEEVELWMGRAEDLVVRLCPMKSFYCLVRAHSISSEVREVCGKLAATVRSLRKLLVHPDESLIQSLQLDMRHLRIRISKINFRVREEVDRFFEKMRKTVGRMYNKHLDQKKGRLVMERMMERVMQRRLSDMDLGEAPRLLHQDLYRARMNKDEIEEHYINQILALTTPDAAPPEYQCPISKEIMEDPVILFETGVIYDKKEIDKWFDEYGEFTCPVSRKELSSKAYVEVRSLKSLIQDWKRAKSEPLSDIEDDESTASALESLGSPSGFDIWQAAPETDSMSDFDVYSTTSIPETSASQKTVAGFLRAGIGYFLRSQPRLTQEELFYEPEDLQTAVSGSSNGEPTAIETPGGGRRRTNQDDMKKIKKAVIDNDLELLTEMHADGLEMDKPDRKHGATPLHYATEMGHQDILEFVLSTGARVNAQTHDSYAPLHFAVAQGSIDSVRILLEAHACVDLQAEGGWTPLHLSQNSNNIEIGNLLLEAGADPNITLLQDGLTPLHRAAFQHHTAFAELLLSHPKIAVDQLTQTSSESTGGRSAADIAASRGYMELYRMIKKRGNSRRRLQT